MPSRRLALAVPLIAAVAFAFARAADDAPAPAPNTLTDRQKADGWRLLFDGKSLAGWRGYKMDAAPESWEVRDEAIYCNDKPGPDIMTADTFADFELSLQWKCSPGANSGIHLRTTETTPDVGSNALEVQVIDTSEGWKKVHGYALGPGNSSGAVYGLYPTKPDAIREAGQWNTVRIRMVGPSLRVEQNGVLIADADMTSDDWNKRIASGKWAAFPQFNKAPAGHIAFQNYRGLGVWYRNITIRTIKADAPAEPKADAPAPDPQPIAYTSFRKHKLDLHAWRGRRVAILTETADLDPAVMATLTAKLDRVYEFYTKATGREPHKYKTTFLDERSTVAVVADTCGAGCGMVGATGIELTPDTFMTLYRGVKNRDQWDQVICYEFGRNFWFCARQLEYRGDDNPRSVQTGYAVFMRFMAMEAAELKGGPFRGKTFDQFKATVEGLVDLYEKDPALNWSNTLRVDAAPANPMGLNGTDLFAGFCFRLRTKFGNDFIARLWQEAAKRPPAKTSQDALDNFALAASTAAGEDLTPLFADQWRWPISDAAKQEAAKIAGAKAN